VASDLLDYVNACFVKLIKDKVEKVFALRHILSVLASLEVKQEGLNESAEVDNMHVHLWVQWA
jgi:hypothetical protein